MFVFPSFVFQEPFATKQLNSKDVPSIVEQQPGWGEGRGEPGHACKLSCDCMHMHTGPSLAQIELHVQELSCTWMHTGPRVTQPSSEKATAWYRAAAWGLGTPVVEGSVHQTIIGLPFLPSTRISSLHIKWKHSRFFSFSFP